MEKKFMKERITSLFVFLMISITSFAQKEVVKFLGIPVDGFKKDMIQKLQAKGFEYNKIEDCLTGEFNGEKVTVLVMTKNNKVWRIALIDDMQRSEAQIKIRYNNLCQQFINNKKYFLLSQENPIIPESERIQHEMIINNKEYQASFCQNLSIATDSVAYTKYVQDRMLKFLQDDCHMSIDSIKALPQKELEELNKEVSIKLMNILLDELSNRRVWFTINEEYGNYSISMFYENVYNDSNGEDL